MKSRGLQEKADALSDAREKVEIDVKQDTAAASSSSSSYKLIIFYTAKTMSQKKLVNTQTGKYLSSFSQKKTKAARKKFHFIFRSKTSWLLMFCDILAKF